MSLFHLLASACTRLVPNLLRADPVAQGPRRLPKGEVARYPPGPKSQPEGPLRAPGMGAQVPRLSSHHAPEIPTLRMSRLLGSRPLRSRDPRDLRPWVPQDRPLLTPFLDPFSRSEHGDNTRRNPRISWGCERAILGIALCACEVEVS